jgi:hypothetical protein
VNQPESVPVLLGIIESSKSSGAMKEAALQALQRYDSDEIGLRVVKAYPQFRGDAGVRNAALELFAARALAGPINYLLHSEKPKE